MNSVGTLASGVWDDMGQPLNPSVSYISGRLGSDRMLGKLNVLLNTSFCIDATGTYSGQSYNAGAGTSGIYDVGDFYPAFGNTEQSIYTEIFKIQYYDTKIRDALNGIFDTSQSGVSIDWSELREGDTTIKRSNRNEVVKTYRGLQNDSSSNLEKLVAFYRSNLGEPSQIINDSLYT